MSPGPDLREPRRLRVCIALPGLHAVSRGAEVAMESVGRELAAACGMEVTLIGTGRPRADAPYQFIHAGAVSRSRLASLPSVPTLRTPCQWEEASFVPAMLRVYRPGDYDLTVSCSWPWVHWLMRRRGDRKPTAHVFVTQNGDHMIAHRRMEYRWFGCDGLVCTNPEYYERHRAHYRAALIPNGVDPDRFTPRATPREGGPVRVLMVSALIPSKRVMDAIDAVALHRDARLTVAGDGELADRVRAHGAARLGARFELLSVSRDEMPALYRSADLLLHMSLDEPSANAYIEALASGLPVLTHDRAVTRWTLDNTGVLVDTTDLAAVSRAIDHAAQLSERPHVERRRDLVKRRYAWSSIAQDYARFFREVVGARQSHTAGDVRSGNRLAAAEG